MKEKNNQSKIILYKTDDGRIKVDTIFQNETIWITSKFQTTIPKAVRDNLKLYVNNAIQWKIEKQLEAIESLPAAILRETFNFQEPN